MTTEDFMHLAQAEAEKVYKNGHGMPFGAVIVKNNQVLASAHNESMKRKDPSAHSELLAIRKARRLLGPDLRGCILYSTCQPCNMCMHACEVSRIDTVYYEDAQAMPDSYSARKYSKIHLRKEEPIKDEDIEQTTWQKSFLRQVESDEKNMLIALQNTTRRASDNGGIPSTASAGSMRSSASMVNVRTASSNHVTKPGLIFNVATSSVRGSPKSSVRGSAAYSARSSGTISAKMQKASRAILRSLGSSRNSIPSTENKHIHSSTRSTASQRSTVSDTDQGRNVSLVSRRSIGSTGTQETASTASRASTSSMGSDDAI